jgi:hypothetical protein
VGNLLCGRAAYKLVTIIKIIGIAQSFVNVYKLAVLLRQIDHWIACAVKREKFAI